MTDFIETWKVVVKGNTYTLSSDRAKLLQDQISAGSRGILVFPDYSISIPYIEEFYLAEKKPIEQAVLPLAEEDQATDPIQVAIWKLKPKDFSNNVSGVPDGIGHHTENRTTHKILNFTKILMNKCPDGEILLRWGHCQECGFIYHKTIWGISSDGTCYIRDIVRAGVTITPNIQPS